MVRFSVVEVINEDEEEEEVIEEEGEEEREFEIGPEPPVQLKLTSLLLSTFTQKLEGKKRELVLRGNDLYKRKSYRLQDSDMKKICRWLRKRPEVTAVDLSYNRLTSVGVEELVQLLQESDHITRLNLMGNDIGWEGMEKLTRMGNTLTLQSLRVNGNKFGSEGGKMLGILLDHNTHLRHLDVGDSDQTTTGLSYLLGAMQCSNNTLQFLDISRPVGFQFDHAYTMNLISDVLLVNTGLKQLVLQKMNFVDSDVETLMRGLTRNQTLLLLDLSCNELGDDALTLLSEFLYCKPPLRALMLGHNKIRDLGLFNLSQAIQRSRLEILDLASNQLTDSGLVGFLNTLKKPRPLKMLYLWGNGIGELSARVIRRMLYSGVLRQEFLDVIVYRRDHELMVALNPVDHYKHVYYSVGDYGFPPPIRFKPPCPDVIPTDRLLKKKSWNEDRRRTDINKCPQATTLDARFILMETEYEHEDDLQEETSSSDKDVELKEEEEDETKHTWKHKKFEMDGHEGCIAFRKGLTSCGDETTSEEDKLEESARSVSIQTSLEFDGIPRFSCDYEPYRPPYPIGMVSEIEEANKVPPEPSLFPEVKAAYVHKYYLPDEFGEDDYNLSNDPSYRQNIPQPVVTPPESEPQSQVEEESGTLQDTPESEPYVSSESEPGETISKYQILEKKMFGMQPPSPLPQDYEEAVETVVHELKRDSERSLYQVVEDCYRVIQQNCQTLAWKAFGRNIVLWAMEKAFDEVAALREDTVKGLVMCAFEGVFEGEYISIDIMERAIEKVFQTIVADREELGRETVKIATERAIHQIQVSVEALAQDVIRMSMEGVLGMDSRAVSRDMIQKAVDVTFHELGVSESAIHIEGAVSRVFQELSAQQVL